MDKRHRIVIKPCDDGEVIGQNGQVATHYQQVIEETVDNNGNVISAFPIQQNLIFKTKEQLIAQFQEQKQKIEAEISKINEEMV